MGRTALVRFCHRGYPASTETPYLINLVESALEPIPPHPFRCEGILAGHTANPLGEPLSGQTRMTSDAGNGSPEREESLRRRCPRHAPPSDPRFWRGGGAVTRASSTSRCQTGDQPNAETLERSVTTSPGEGSPSSPLRACARQALPFPRPLPVKEVRRRAVSALCEGESFRRRIRRAHRA